MKDMAHMQLIPAQGATAMPESQCRRILENLPQWHIVTIEGTPRLKRSFSFPDFSSALAFTVQIAELAEADQHHPEILTAWGKVTVSWWTHSLNGLHMNDFIMAARTNELFLPS